MSLVRREAGTWPFEHVPQKWQWADFDAVFKNVTDSRRKLKRSQYQASGQFIVIDQGEVDPAGYSNDEDLVHPGPIPVLVFGDHTRSVKYVDTPFIQGADGVKVLAPRVDPKFAFRALQTIRLPDKGYSRHFKFLRESQFPVPPLAEQRRIVAKIDALQARSRRAREALEAIPPLIERFRQSVLAAAFRGDLTADWRAEHPDVEPASVLLDRIRAERRERWTEDYAEKRRAKAEEKVRKAGKSWSAEKDAAVLERERAKAAGKYEEPEPVDPEAEGLPELPEGWAWASFDIVAQVASNLVDPALYPNSPHIAPNHIESGTGRLLPFSTVAEDEVISGKHLFYPGQILYSKIRPYLAKAVVVDFSGLCSADMYPITTFLEPSFLHAWLLTSRFTGLASRQQGRTVLPKINRNSLVKLPVPVAPIREQAELALRVRRAMLSVADTAEHASIMSGAIDRLDSAILAKAFRGELVPQDPDDEPASALLERIAAERHE